MNNTMFMKNKTFTKICAALLAVTMLFVFCISSAFADESEKTFKYVALGDSVVAGNGLEYSDNCVPYTGLFMEDNANDQYAVKGSYPSVFGEKLAEYLGESYSVTAKNLGQCGYSSANLLNALNGNTTMTAYQNFTIGRYDTAFQQYYKDFTSSQAKFDKNTEILNTNIADADLISIGSGLNDISESVISPLITDEGKANPIMTVFRMAFLAKVNGVDIPYDDLITLLQTSDITMENVTDFIQYVMQIPTSMVSSCVNNVQNTKKIVQYIEENNPDAQIALISSYNPFGNSLTCDGVTYGVVQVSKQIVQAIIEVYCSDTDVSLDTDVIVDGAEGMEDETADTCCSNLYSDLTSLVNMLKQPKELIEATKVTELATNVSERLSYLISFSTIGLISTPFYMMINSGLKQIAACDSNVTYVNIYGIPNENNSNPHPDEDGHAYIANQMAKKLFSKLNVD